jgi:hypothetical protein
MVESNFDDQSKVVKSTVSNGIPLRNSNGGMRVRKIQPTLPVALIEQKDSMTPGQINAFSKESLLKPVIARPTSLMMT